MKQSESVSRLVDALMRSQSQFKPVPKSKTGQEGNRRFKYADLADVVGMVTPILNANGVFLSQPIEEGNDGNLRQTTRLQCGDEYIQTDGVKLADDIPGKNLGISVTYARRIDLNGLLGIAPDEDVDAPDLSPEKPNTVTPVKTATKTIQTPNKATSFSYGANTQITDADLPKEMFEQSEQSTTSTLATDARATAIEMENFVPLTEARNGEIQNRLKELVQTKVAGRRELSLFLEEQHGGKKQFDVSASQWEATLAKIEAAIVDGTIKTLLKTKKV